MSFTWFQVFFSFHSTNSLQNLFRSAITNACLVLLTLFCLQLLLLQLLILLKQPRLIYLVYSHFTFSTRFLVPIFIATIMDLNILNLSDNIDCFLYDILTCRPEHYL